MLFPWFCWWDFPTVGNTTMRNLWICIIWLIANVQCCLSRFFEPATLTQCGCRTSTKNIYRWVISTIWILYGMFNVGPAILLTFLPHSASSFLRPFFLSLYPIFFFSSPHEADRRFNTRRNKCITQQIWYGAMLFCLWETWDSVGLWWGRGWFFSVFSLYGGFALPYRSFPYIVNAFPRLRKANLLRMVR